MGLGIIESIADKVEYMRVDDQNRLIITIKHKDD